MSNDFSDIDQIALPVSSELGRVAYQPSRAGELTADVRTGEPFYAKKVGATLTWNAVVFPNDQDMLLLLTQLNAALRQLAVELQYV